MGFYRFANKPGPLLKLLIFFQFLLIRIFIGMPAPRPFARFTLEDYSLLHSRLMWCYEGEVVAENIRKHVREHHSRAWLLRRGSVILRAGGKSWSARTGEWIFAPAQPHFQHFSPRACILSINFHVAWPSGEALIDQPLVVQASDFPGLERAARPLLRFSRRHFPGRRNDIWGAPIDLAPFFQLQQHFYRWMAVCVHAVLARGARPTRMAGLDPRVLKALLYLDRRPWTGPFREKELAENAGLSVSHLNRLFAQQLGTTPRAYLEKRRFESAAALLAQEDMPIKRIAYDLGFSWPAAFTHWFYKLAGQSPRRFRLSVHGL
jgi:AraC-like DNA-binding protein